MYIQHVPDLRFFRPQILMDRADKMKETKIKYWQIHHLRLNFSQIKLMQQTAMYRIRIII
jgi:hypothetical protein